MKRKILVTGATGALGPTLVAGLLRSGLHVDLLLRPRRLAAETRFRAIQNVVRRELGEAETSTELEGLGWIPGDLVETKLGLDDVTYRALVDDLTGILHAGADTGFRSALEQQRAVNVAGTREVLRLAETCRELPTVVTLSTTCVSGQRTCRIPETFEPDPVGFVNDYERTKWEAEEAVVNSGFPAQILRLSTVIGSEAHGGLYRTGAFHEVLRWFYRGLISMVPGTARTRIDFISTEQVSRAVQAAFSVSQPTSLIAHIAAGRRAAPLEEMIDLGVDLFRGWNLTWARRQFSRPPVVDRETYVLLEETVRQSEDALLNRILDAMSSFMPSLFFPREYETENGDALLGDAAPASWAALLERTLESTLDPPRREEAHAPS